MSKRDVEQISKEVWELAERLTAGDEGLAITQIANRLRETGVDPDALTERFHEAARAVAERERLAKRVPPLVLQQAIEQTAPPDVLPASQGAADRKMDSWLGRFVGGGVPQIDLNVARAYRKSDDLDSGDQADLDNLAEQLKAKVKRKWMREKSDAVLATANAFLKRFGVDVGKRLHEVLGDLGLELHWRSACSYEGALLRIVGAPRGYVVLNQDVTLESRRRFTLAHEVGHYLMPNQQELAEPCSKSKLESWDEGLAKPEVEANRFAAEILMPRAVVAPFLARQPSFKTVQEISTACGTSLTASAYRVSELSSFRVAMVWSDTGRARWYQASGEFVRWIRKGPLDPRTFAYDVNRRERARDRMESVPASAWLFASGLREDSQILEHSVPVSDTAVLTLLLIDEAIEVEESGGLDELDPNEFTLRRTRWPEKK